MSDEAQTDYVLPRTVRLTIGVFYLSNYYKPTNQGTVSTAIDKLAEHNLQLDVWPYGGVKGEGNLLEWEDRLVEEEDQAEIYAMAKEVLRQRCNFIIPVPVIYCQYRGAAHGITVPNSLTGGITDMCFISTEVNKDQMTLLHELGHAAGCGHDTYSTNPKNFMREDEPRSTVFKYQVQRFAKATFAVST